MGPGSDGGGWFHTDSVKNIHQDLLQMDHKSTYWLATPAVSGAWIFQRVFATEHDA